MQAITAAALPSSVPSPQPITPPSVSSLTNTNGRSESGVSETPNTFMLVIFRREPTPRNASAPRGFCGGASAHPHDTPARTDLPASTAPAAPLQNLTPFILTLTHPPRFPSRARCVTV